MNFCRKARPLGPMRIQRRGETEPSYARLLRRYGFIHKLSTLCDAYGKWQRVCADSEVIRLSMRLEAKKHSLPSVAAPYQFGARVLASMTEKQITALKERVGAK